MGLLLDLDVVIWIRLLATLLDNDKLLLDAFLHFIELAVYLIKRMRDNSIERFAVFSQLEHIEDELRLESKDELCCLVILKLILQVLLNLIQRLQLH